MDVDDSPLNENNEQIEEEGSGTNILSTTLVPVNFQFIDLMKKNVVEETISQKYNIEGEVFFATIRHRRN